jgi:hypothetical protein
MTSMVVLNSLDNYSPSSLHQNTLVKTFKTTFSPLPTAAASVSAALQKTKEAATTGLEAVRSRRSRLEGFERDKEALLEYHASLVPEVLYGLTPK